MFQIDLVSRVPVYEQLTEQLEHFILTDIFKAEQQIPSIRSVSLKYSINPRTVLKAYNDLDKRGLVQSVPGKGYFVSRDAKQKLSEANHAKLTELTEMIKEMALAGVTKENVLLCVESAYKDNTEGGNKV